MIHYMVEVCMFDWDSDHYKSQWKQFQFKNRDEANAFYDMVVGLDYKEEIAGRPCMFIAYGREEGLATTFGFFHGGVFDETPRMHRITVESVER